MSNERCLSLLLVTLACGSLIGYPALSERWHFDFKFERSQTLAVVSPGPDCDIIDSPPF
jgi:hypothetical protein